MTKKKIKIKKLFDQKIGHCKKKKKVRQNH